MSFPSWLQILAMASLGLGGACALIIVLDLVTGHAQHMWIMMQIAMWLGFATSYPVNWWLLKRGLKEAMQHATRAGQ